MGSYLSIITLNVNGLNVPTKRQRLAEWNQNQQPWEEESTNTGNGNAFEIKRPAT